jgi:hypothetical protein
MYPEDYMERHHIESAYTKDAIEGGLFALVKAFYLKDTDPDWQNAETIENTNILLKKKSFTKSEMVKIAYSVFYNEEVYFAFLKSLPSTVAKVLERLVWRDSMSLKEVEIFLNSGLSDVSPKIPVPKELSMFTDHTTASYDYNNNYHYPNHISLAKGLKECIIRYYLRPDYFDFIPLQDITETTYKYNAQKQIFDELPHFISYHLLGNIKFSASGRPVESTLGKFQKSCGIGEFYNSKEESLGKMRSNLIAGMLYDLTQKDVDTDSIEIIKYFFKERYFKLYTAQFILSHFKGWNFVNSYYERHTGVEKKLMDVLKDMPSQDWVSIENLIELLAHRSINPTPVQVNSRQTNLYYEVEVSGGEAIKTILTTDNIHQFVTEPFIKGSIFLYAAFGLMEVGYVDANTVTFGKTYFSNYDGLKYFKLTPLGAYIFGIKSTFEHEEVSTEKNKLSLSNDSLMIIADGNMVAMTDQMLNTYSEKLGNTRYRVSAYTFLKDCKSRKDIESKIALFKTIINNTIPTNWERFFKELVTNSTAIKINKFVITYTLPLDDKELHRLVAQDGELKQLVLKAEGFNLLVPVDNQSKFKSRMKELGFIVE